MTSDEFPRIPDAAPLSRLLRALAAEHTPNTVDARQRRLADSAAAVLGMDIKTDRAAAAFGAFLDDLTTHGGPRDPASMTLAFRRWHDCGEESANLYEFGFEEEEDLTEVMQSVAVLLWDTGGVGTCSHDVEAWDAEESSIAEKDTPAVGRG